MYRNMIDRSVYMCLMSTLVILIVAYKRALCKYIAEKELVHGYYKDN